mmetsp:Transcript_12087/g.21868  ORF Transcript_12087/g.21868 Transcript_12087/m.21868 type:complete len:84 (+) Transcript_12087:50-301(+)
MNHPVSATAVESVVRNNFLDWMLTLVAQYSNLVNVHHCAIISRRTICGLGEFLALQSWWKIFTEAIILAQILLYSAENVRIYR